MPERRSLMLFPICDVVRFVKFSPFGKKDYTNRGERKRKLTQIIVRSRFGTSVRLGPAFKFKFVFFSFKSCVISAVCRPIWLKFDTCLT